MGLFDFLDLQGNTGAWDAAGAAGQNLQQGMKSGADLAAQDYGVLAKFEEINMRKKEKEGGVKDQLDILKQVQELNTMPIVPNADDERIAAIEVLGGEDKIGAGQEISMDDLNAIQQRKYEIANASIPQLTLENPLPWLQARLARTGLRSDAEEKELAAIRSEERDYRKIEAADKKLDKQQKFQAEEARKAQEAMLRNLNIKLKQQKAIHGENLNQRQKEKDEALAQSRAKELDAFVGSTGVGKIRSRELSAREFLAKLQAIKKADSGVYEQKVQQYSELLNSDAVNLIRKKNDVVKGKAPDAVKKKGKVRFVNKNGIMTKVVE